MLFYQPGRDNEPPKQDTYVGRGSFTRNEAIAFLVVGAFVVLLLFPPYWAFPPFGSIGSSIGREVRAHPERLIDIASFTHFEWDEFFSYTPYSSLRSGICKELALEWEACQWTVPLEINDDSSPSLLVFRKGAEIVHREYLDQADGMISYWPRPVRRGEALYRVSDSFGRTILVHVNADDE